MRDVAVTLIVVFGLFYTLKRPYIGVLLWSWLSYMNPHRLTWGFAYSMPFAQLTAITLMVSMFMSTEKKNFPKNGMMGLWIVFLLWMGVTTLFAFFPDDALQQYIKVLKIQLIIFLTIMLITDYEKLKALIWVIVVSVGVFGFKGGIFTLMTAGAYRVWGPPGTFIYDNNGLAVATLMIIPLCFYLYRINNHKWIKRGLLAAIILCFGSALGSQSRGALLAILSVAGYFWLISNKKMITIIPIIFALIIGLSFMPDSWHERMATIKNYEEDKSAMGRINAWAYSINVASDRITGAGFESWSVKTFSLYAPDPLDVHAAHSIYFAVLGDHGWPGLLMFLGILWFGWRNLNVIINFSDNREWAFLAKMIKVSLIAYMSGGAFLSLAYFDLPWHLLSITIILRLIAAGDTSMPKPSLSRDPRYA